MKKSLLALLAIVSILLPMTVKAESAPLKGDIYSESASINSKIVFSIKRGENRNLKGTLTYDNNILEFVEVREKYVGTSGVWAGNSSLDKTVELGKVNIDYRAGGESDINIEIVFKVKSAPANGKVTLKFAPSDNSWSNSIEKTIAVEPEKKCAVCEKDEVNCPVCETCKECSDNVVNNNTDDSKDSKTNDILFYGALGSCGFLAILVLVLAIKKSN